MNAMKRIVCVVVAIAMACGARAQYDAAFTNYWTLQSYFNPAASGLGERIDINAAYSMQLVGFENAPATLLATADAPLFFIGPRHGVGVGFINDNIGLFSNKKLYAQYAYHLPLGDKGSKGKLSIGARVGLLNETFDGTELDVEDSGDPAFATTEVDGTSIDIDAGLRYTYKKVWYVGISSMHLTAPTIRLGDSNSSNQTDVNRLYYITGGYTLRFKRPEYALYTSCIGRTDLQAWRADVTARLAYDGERLHMYGGLSYSPTISVALLLGTTFSGFRVGYSYEMYTGVGVWSGTHELVVGYELDLDLFKKGRNRHQSVRIL